MFDFSTSCIISTVFLSDQGCEKNNIIEMYSSYFSVSIPTDLLPAVKQAIFQNFSSCIQF